MTHTMKQLQIEIEDKLFDTLLLTDALSEDKLFQRVQNGESLSGEEGNELIGLLSNYTSIGEARVEHFYIVSMDSEIIYSDTGRFSMASLPAILSKFGIYQEDLELLLDTQEINWCLLTETGFSPFCIIPLITDEGTVSGFTLIMLHLSDYLRVFTNLDASFCAIFDEDGYITSLLTNIPVGFDWYSVDAVSELVGEQVYCSYLTEGKLTYLLSGAVSGTILSAFADHH